MDSKKLQTMLLFFVIAMLGMWAFNYFKGGNNAAPAAAPSATAPGMLGLPEGVRPFAPLGQWAAPDTRTLGDATPASAGGKYKLGLKISNVNAGIEWVKLSEYAEEVGPPKAGQPFSDRLTLLSASDQAFRPFATLHITATIGGVVTPIKDIRDDMVLSTWQFVEPANPNEVRMRMYINEKDTQKCLCEIFKVFRIVDPSSYEVEISYEVVNHDQKEMTIAIDQAGPVNMVRDSVQSDLRLFQGASFVDSTIKGDYKVIGQLTFTKDKLAPQELGSFAATTDPLVWTAESNRFFTAVVRPAPGGVDMGKPLSLSNSRGVGHDIEKTASFGNATAEMVVPPDLGDWQNHPEKWVMGEVIRGTTMSVAPNHSPVAVSTMRVYLGPQDRGLLKGSIDAPKSSIPYTYNLYSYLSIINFKRAGCTFCVFSDLAIVILGLLDFIHRYITFGNYGLAIILLVVVVRLLLHPLTRYSQVSMAKMQNKMKKVQPELERIKKKYEKDKAKLQEETMKLYKEHGVNPAGQALGCLPMLLQMPIWAALYSGLAVDIDLRHAGFIPGWINDLSNPDTLIKFSEPVTVPVLSWLTRGPISGINLLPILLAVVFFMQQKIQAASMPKAQDETQAQTQMISKYMILLFPVFLYLAPSGLNLYIFASTAGGIFDTWLVRRHLRATGILPPVGEVAA